MVEYLKKMTQVSEIITFGNIEGLLKRVAPFYAHIFVKKW